MPFIFLILNKNLCILYFTIVYFLIHLFLLRYFDFEPSFKLRWCRTRHHRSLKLGSKLKYLNIDQLLQL